MEITLISKNKINQIVLTPENDYEKEILKLINSKDVESTMKVGNFSECRGGYIRYFAPPIYMHGVNGENIDSLMIVLKEKENK